MRTIDGFDELRAASGEEIGVSRWQEVDQTTIDAFSDISGDRNPLHLDPEVGARSPFGSTIAHGLYTLSLSTGFTAELVRFENLGLVINMGFDRVRFVAPVLVDTKVRMRLALGEVTDVRSGVNIALLETFESEQGTAVCIATAVLRCIA